MYFVNFPAASWTASPALDAALQHPCRVWRRTEPFADPAATRRCFASPFGLLDRSDTSPYPASASHPHNPHRRKTPSSVQQSRALSHSMLR